MEGVDEEEMKRDEQGMRKTWMVPNRRKGKMGIARK